jgi:hypothetical protein
MYPWRSVASYAVLHRKFYATVKNAGRYEIVDSLADVELIVSGSERIVKQCTQAQL